MSPEEKGEQLDEWTNRALARKNRKRLYSKGRNRALSELSFLHTDEYHELLNKWLKIVTEEEKEA